MVYCSVLGMVSLFHSFVENVDVCVVMLESC